MRCRAALLCLLAFTVGCAKRAPETYRLVARPSSTILVPPRVAGPEVVRRVFKTAIVAGRKPCPSGEGAVLAERRGKTLRLTVTRDVLEARPAGWLNRWTAIAESDGCVAPGEGLHLAASVLEALPMDPAAAYRLLHEGSVRSGFVDLGPADRLQMNSPILEAGAPPGAPLVESSKITGLTVEVKLAPSVIGFETAIFALRAKPQGIGYTVVPLSAVRRIAGVVEPATSPSVNPLQFPPQAAFYRLFYKFWKNDTAEQSIVALAGATRADLEALTREVAADPTACDQGQRPMCRVIPRHVGLNPMTAVIVNGREVMVPLPATVGEAIRAAGELKPESALPKLIVRKPYAGKPAAVDFDRANPNILRLNLTGGEEISWLP